jgi:hypothetical protein
MARDRFAPRYRGMGNHHTQYGGLREMLQRDRTDPYAEAAERKAKAKARKATKGHGLRNAENDPGVAAQALKASKEWIVTNPQGEEIHVINLCKFCRDNDLDYKTMQYVAAGKRDKTRAGWKVRPKEKEQDVKEN